MLQHIFGWETIFNNFVYYSVYLKMKITLRRKLMLIFKSISSFLLDIHAHDEYFYLNICNALSSFLAIEGKNSICFKNIKHKESFEKL